MFPREPKAPAWEPPCVMQIAESSPKNHAVHSYGYGSSDPDPGWRGGRGGSVFRVTSVEALRRPTDTGEFEVHRHALRL
jgi:hypothetical protein